MPGARAMAERETECWALPERESAAALARSPARSVGRHRLQSRGLPHVTEFGSFNGSATLTRGVIYSVHAQDIDEQIGLMRITSNSSVDPAKSHPAHTTAVVAPARSTTGTVILINRQSFGYSTGSVEGLYSTPAVTVASAASRWKRPAAIAAASEDLPALEKVATEKKSRDYPDQQGYL
jgi:hypothetical protein